MHLFPLELLVSCNSTLCIRILWRDFNRNQNKFSLRNHPWWISGQFPLGFFPSTRQICARDRQTCNYASRPLCLCGWTWCWGHSGKRSSVPIPVHNLPKGWLPFLRMIGDRSTEPPDRRLVSFSRILMFFELQLLGPIIREENIYLIMSKWILESFQVVELLKNSSPPKNNEN